MKDATNTHKKRGPKKGFRHTQESKDLMSKTRQARNFKHSEETKLSMSKKRRGKKNPSYTPFSIEVIKPNGDTRVYNFRGSAKYPSPLNQARAKLCLTQTIYHRMKTKGLVYMIKMNSKMAKFNKWAIGTTLSLTLLDK